MKIRIVLEKGEIDAWRNEPDFLDLTREAARKISVLLNRPVQVQFSNGGVVWETGQP